MGNLDGRMVFVAGGAGEVGEGVVRALLLEGARVMTVSRSAARLEALRRRVPASVRDRLVTRLANLGTLEGAEIVHDLVAGGLGPLHAVVASLGGWWEGAPMTRVPEDTWERILDDNLTSHLVTAQMLLPLVCRSGCSYVLLNGAAALEPVPGAGPISVVGAAQVMLKDVLAAETADTGVRVNSVVIMTPVLSRSRPEGPEDWLSADEVGRYVGWLVSDAAASVRGQTLKLDVAELRRVLPLARP